MSQNTIAQRVLFAALLAGCQGSQTVIEEGADAADMAPSSVPDQGAQAGGVRLSGSITRTAMPKAGGKGPLYIAVFEGNPVVDSKKAVLVGRTVIDEADLAAADARVSYRIEGIAPSAKERQVLAFLDDNRTAMPPSPGPDAGDLVTLEGIGGIKVSLPMEADVTLNLVLNAVVPKL